MRRSRRSAKQSSTNHGDIPRPRADLVGRNRSRRPPPVPHHDPIRRDPRPEQRPRSTRHSHDQRHPHRTTTRNRRRHAHRLRRQLRQPQSRPQGLPGRPDLRTTAGPARRSMRRRSGRHRLLDKTLRAMPCVARPRPRPLGRGCTNACVGGGELNSRNSGGVLCFVVCVCAAQCGFSCVRHSVALFLETPEIAPFRAKLMTN